MRAHTLHAVLAIALFATVLPAQDPPALPPNAQAASATATDAVKEDGGKLAAYFAIPEIPATTMLGISPASITRPATHKDFVSSILDGIDADGRVKQGIAIEGSLGLLKAFQVSLDTYQKDRRARLWSNTLVSFATTRVAGDTASTDVAWGLRIPLVDRGDPFAVPGYTAALGRSLLRCAPAQPPANIPPNTGQTQEQLDLEATQVKADTTARQAQQLACLERVASEIGQAAADSLWNATRLTIAYAGSMRLAESSIEDRQTLGDRFWAVGSIPLARITGPVPIARSSQLIGYVDYERRRAIDTVPAFSRIGYGARINIGSSTVNGFYEILGETLRDAPFDAPSRNSTWSAGIEFLATEGVWISTGFGKRAEDVLKPDKTVVLANIRWGISRKAFLSPGSSGT